MTLRNPLPDNSLAEHWDVRLCSLRFNIDFSLSLSLSNMIFSLLRVWTPNNWSSTQTEPFVSLNHFQLFRIIKTVSINFSNIKYISERLKKKNSLHFDFHISPQSETSSLSSITFNWEIDLFAFVSFQLWSYICMHTAQQIDFMLAFSAKDNHKLS